MANSWEYQKKKREAVTLETLEDLFDDGKNFTEIARLYPDYFRVGQDVKKLYQEYLTKENPESNPCEHCGRSLDGVDGKMHLARCVYYQLCRREMFPRGRLYDLYITQGLSANVIGEDAVFGGAASVIALLKEYGIETRSISESCYQDDSRERRRKTLLKRTGYPHNLCKNSPSRKKWERRLLREEGITNVFQRESVKRKSVKTLIKKYGVDTPGKLPARGRKVVSSLNRAIIKFLQENDIEFKIEKKVARKNGSYYSYDFYFPKVNGLMEVNGDYWHGNPLLYRANDLILKGTSSEMRVSRKWEKDKKKLNFTKRS